MQEQSTFSKYLALRDADFFANPEFKTLVTEFLDKSEANSFEAVTVITAPAASEPAAEPSPAPAASFPAQAPIPHQEEAISKHPQGISQPALPPYHIPPPATLPKVKRNPTLEEQITSDLLSSLMQFVWE